MTHRKINSSVLSAVLLSEDIDRERCHFLHAFDDFPTAIGAAVVNHIPLELLAILMGE